MPSSAMNDLDLAIRILERGADYSWYARVALVSIRKPYNDPHPPYLMIALIFFHHIALRTANEPEGTQRHSSG